MASGKKMMKEAQQERKRLVDTGRAFKFRGGKEVYSITPGENPKVKFKSTIEKDAGRTPTKKFKKGKELEKKADGGRIGRRFGSPKPKTNVQKIKETFSPKSGLKKIDPEKQKGLAKLKKERPDVVRKMGYMKKGTNPFKKETNVDKIKKTFAPKGKNLKPVDKKKNPGLAKLPIEVRNKMGYAKKGGRA